MCHPWLPHENKNKTVGFLGTFYRVFTIFSGFSRPRFICDHVHVCMMHPWSMMHTFLFTLSSAIRGHAMHRPHSCGSCKSRKLLHLAASRNAHRPNRIALTGRIPRTGQIALRLLRASPLAYKSAASCAAAVRCGRLAATDTRTRPIFLLSTNISLNSLVKSQCARM